MRLRAWWLAIPWVLVACAKPPPTPVGAPPAEPTPAASAPVDVAAIDDAQIDADVALVVGGTYGVDHQGPEVVAAIEARIAAAPGRYATAVLRAIDAMGSDERLADLYFTHLLGRLYRLAPDEVSRAAGLLMLRHGYLAASTIDPARRRRIAADQSLLMSLVGGIDRAWVEGWAKATPDRVCSGATPEGHGIRVELACTCGEVPVCRAEVDGDRVHLGVRLDATQPKRCFDCYPGFSTCTLPRLASGQRLRLDIDGRAHGEWVATPGGWLTPEVCVAPSMTR